MPKAKKLRAPALESQQVRHEPLGQVMEGDAHRGKYAMPSRRRPNKRSSKGAAQDEYLDEKTSKKILEMSREQDMEEELEEQRAWQRKNQSGKEQNAVESDEEYEEEVEEIFIEDGEDYIETDKGYVSIKDGTLGISPEDEDIVAAMNKSSEGGGGEERQTLADLIMGKIAEKEARDRGEVLEDKEDALPPLPKKVVDVYTEIGKILSRYTSGKLPKAFKVIPSLSNWEQVLYLTRPDLWTPQAMYAGE
jgi:essential nuclear protein 1